MPSGPGTEVLHFLMALFTFSVVIGTKGSLRYSAGGWTAGKFSGTVNDIAGLRFQSGENLHKQAALLSALVMDNLLHECKPAASEPSVATTPLIAKWVTRMRFAVRQDSAWLLVPWKKMELNYLWIKRLWIQTIAMEMVVDTSGEQYIIRYGTSTWLKAAAEHLMLKSLLTTKISKHFRFLNPRDTKKERSVFKIAKAMPVKIFSTKVLGEWKLLNIDPEVKALDENFSCEQYCKKDNQTKKCE
ncbi:hypothetical protein ILUMI_06597 [Ignelater luminosus]|uniref:Uncharacterized protein n=1 Tax=Ignelater luminosus TaxID=2038154 RepID=A0A8K0GF71_IGNLU|nr:hypothetical protein ILUMI_06597 [Ignelater luminosus]